MARYDLRWLVRHPLRWLRIMWFPLALAAVFAALAVVVAEPVFFVTTGAEVWPLLLAAVAGASVTSSFAPLEPRLQAFTASLLFGVAVLRVATYVDTFLRADLSAGARAVVIAFGLHWVLMAAAAVYWPMIIDDAGRRMTVEAGQDGRAC